MRFLIFILFTISLNAQTDLNLDSSVRLQINQRITVGNIKGNGFTIYMKCGSVLIVKGKMTKLRIMRDILIDENCNLQPTLIYQVPNYFYEVEIDGCINLKKMVTVKKSFTAVRQ